MIRSGDYDVVLLAGQRPGEDPLARHFGMELKALVPVHGVPMLDRLLATLTVTNGVRTVHVLAQQAALLAEHMGAAWCAAHPAVRFVTCGPSISGSIIDLIDSGDATYPLLVTTADNVLLTADIITEFMTTRDPAADVAAGMVERGTLLAAYPENRRTWLHFRGGSYSGANLFWFANPRARVALNLWRSIEQDRKKGTAVIGAFGPLILIGSVLRMMTLQGALARAGKRHGLHVAPVVLKTAEAAIDVDKPDDHALASDILRRREG